MDPIFYYGTSIPDIKKTRLLNGVLVVLQEYHPLCAEGLYAAFFPGCRRFMYWNPARIAATAVSPGIKIRSDNGDGYLTIDLRDEDTRLAAVAEGVRAAALPGVDGLFVDDLDAWSSNPADREHAVAVIEATRKAAGRRFPIFLNRAFSLWDRVDSIEAVLLESITPHHVATAPEDAMPWYERIIDLHLAALRETKPDTAVIAVSYDHTPDVDVEGLWPKARSRFENLVLQRRKAVAEAMASLIDRTLFLRPSLDTWPSSLANARLDVPTQVHQDALEA